MFKFKKFVSFALAVALILGSINSSAFVPTETDSFISITLSENYSINQKSSISTQSLSDSVSAATFNLGKSLDVLDVSLLKDGQTYTATLTGEAHTVENCPIVGYMGVYEGVLTSTNGSSGTDIPVIADITFTASEMFAALTLGEFTETTTPEIFFYGEFSNDLTTIVESYNNSTLQSTTIDSNIDNSASANSPTLADPLNAAVNAEIVTQGSTFSTSGAQVTSVMGVFHAPELRNQSSAPIYAKMNSRTAAMTTAIESSGYDVLGYAYPDEINIKIKSDDNKLNIMGDSYKPVSKSKVCDVTVSVSIDFVSVSFGVDIPIDTTTVTLSKTNGSLNDTINWKFSKLTGWDDDLDGNYTNPDKGMMVEVYYRYDGNGAPSSARHFTITGKMRYQYNYVLPTGTVSTVPLHIYANEMSIKTSIAIVD